jgi:hypothetical protein
MMHSAREYQEQLIGCLEQQRSLGHARAVWSYNQPIQLHLRNTQMAVAAYGATNPAGTDPWPIESVLAKEAVSGNPSASIMLGNYQQAREADTNLYNQSMVGQHAFAKQQLADQMAQAR